VKFDQYTLVLLVRPPDAPELSPEEADALQDAHLAFRADLRDQGYLLGGGPLRDQDDERLRGIRARGEQALFDEVRYFFYITTRMDLPIEQVVELANDRCDQENVIEQLKNGVNARCGSRPTTWSPTGPTWSSPRWRGTSNPGSR
jgi:hypothetical protein